MLMEKEGISPSELADKIDIGRPLLSHVMSGRNKPSLQLVLKILEHFPSYSANWLITGNTTENEPRQTNADVPEKTTTIIPQEETEIKFPAQPKKTTVNTSNTESPELIMVMYADKTFESYKPRK